MIFIVKKVHELLKERRHFVGRTLELDLMTNRLSQAPENWGIVHLHGPAGIGKTALLQQLALINKPIPSVYIEGNPTFEHPEQFEQAVYRQLVQAGLIEDTDLATESALTVIVNAIAEKHGALLLLLDGLDEWTEIEQWIREEWLISLSINIKVFSAGRRPLSSWQAYDIWVQLIRNEPLGPLTKPDWIGYAANYGITDTNLLDLIGRLSEGVPLAVTLICNHIHSQGERWQQAQDYRPILNMLDNVMLHPNNLSGIDRRLLDIASLVYTFDHEMLEYILDLPIPDDDFHKLCHSPLVRVHPEAGWSVNNGIRRWAKGGLKARSPEAYEQYKSRAENILERRMTAVTLPDGTLQHKLRSGKVFLQDNDIIHSFVYYDDNQQFHGRPARQEDILPLHKMYQQHIVAYPENLPDTSQQEQYLGDIWKVDPTRIQVFERDGLLAGFYCALPLDHPHLRTILSNNPATRAFIECTAAESHDWLYWLIASDPPLDQGFSGGILRTILRDKLPGKRITMMMPSVEFIEAAKLFGFEAIPQAYYPSTDGCCFHFFRLDARVPEIVGMPGDQADATQWLELTKKLLASYSQLELQEPLLRQCQQLWGTTYSLTQLVTYVRNTIKHDWKRLSQGTLKEQSMAQILRHAYLNRIGTHELVTERLDLPSSTYYRHLNKLIREIARSLQFHRGM
jgi:hypothetical protein